MLKQFERKKKEKLLQNWRHKCIKTQKLTLNLSRIELKLTQRARQEQDLFAKLQQDSRTQVALQVSIEVSSLLLIRDIEVQKQESRKKCFKAQNVRIKQSSNSFLHLIVISKQTQIQKKEEMKLSY
ncbi:hypothetical protein FGO68_gene13335 [Halteria grandinella]|uniref:Uncharacterized protein n=1 Tax=Halteria grandinella TaxID=5974 RepID=A0A8J8NGZ2_HALGN|nr:hypothetical protein FGO68_gene13335 [Halteria grandinella]